MRREKPPLNEAPLGDAWVLQHGSWWGVSHLLLKGEAPVATREEKSLATAVKLASGALPGEPVSFGAAQWSRAHVCERPIEGHPGSTVDAECVLYAEAEAGVQEWRLCQYKTPPESATRAAACLVGFRGEELVAILAPRRATV